jgi:uncharacterized membrane protein
MDAVEWIALWAVLFLATHFVIASATVRPMLVAAVGEQAYRGIYSLASFATLGPLIYEFAYHKHSGPLLWYFRDIAALRWLTWLLMLLALILFVAILVSPNPASLEAPSDRTTPRGVLKITRHPGFVAFSLFGIAHMLMNGWAGDVIFFASFPALGMIGGAHQDARKVREMGERYREFKARTSFMPFAALIGGRQRWTSADVPWAAIGVGAVLTVAIVLLHPIIFGGNPLGINGLR